MVGFRSEGVNSKPSSFLNLYRTPFLCLRLSLRVNVRPKYNFDVPGNDRLGEYSGASNCGWMPQNCSFRCCDLEEKNCVRTAGKGSGKPGCNP